MPTPESTCAERLPTIWTLPDELWERIEPILARRYPPARTGRPRADLRLMLDGIIFRMRTGCQWEQMPERFGPSSTLHGWFQRFVRDGVLEAAYVEGFLANENRLIAEADDEVREDAQFLRAWHAHTQEPLQFREVLDRCGPRGPLRDELPTELAASAGPPEGLRKRSSPSEPWSIPGLGARSGPPGPYRPSSR